MNDEKLREQPEKEPADISFEMSGMSAESDSGSQKDTEREGEFGKFKSPQALLQAYNSLQAEFTRKCQKLSEFEKEKTTENTLSDAEVEEGLSKFLLENTDAKDYSDELVKKVKSEKDANPFENAWAKIFMERMASKNTQKFSDPLIKKYVFEDEDLKSKVIEIYMKELNSKKPPIIFSSEKGQRATKLEPVAPTSLKEAKKLMEDLFS